jgi:uncharacterized membrane protein YqjE
MNDIIGKIEQTLEVLDPFIILVLTALHASAVIPTFQLWEGILVGLLGVVSLITGIWTVAQKSVKL